MDFAILADHRWKLKESENRDKYLDLVWELKKLEHEGDNDTNYNWCTWNDPQRIGKGTGRLGNKTSGYHLDYSIIKISQNTKKSSGDLRRFAVTQTPVENHQLTLVGKTLKGVIIIIINNPL